MGTGKATKPSVIVVWGSTAYYSTFRYLRVSGAARTSGIDQGLRERLEIRSVTASPILSLPMDG
jgi:hypothetical protein